MELLPPWLLLPSLIATISACIPIIIVSIMESVEGVWKNSRFFPYIWFVSILLVFYVSGSAISRSRAMSDDNHDDYYFLHLMFKQSPFGSYENPAYVQDIICGFAAATFYSITFYLLIFVTVNFLLALNKHFHVFITAWILAFTVTLVYIIIRMDYYNISSSSVISDNPSYYWIK